MSKSNRKDSGITILLSLNNFNTSSLVKEYSTIPSVHSFNHNPQLFLAIIILFKIFGCLDDNLCIFISPFSYFLNENLPSSPLMSKLTFTLYPQKVRIPHLYDFKKNINISLNLFEYFFNFRWFRDPYVFLHCSILSSLCWIRSLLAWLFPPCLTIL